MYKQYGLSRDADQNPCYGCTKRYPGCACEKHLAWKADLHARKAAYKSRYCKFSAHGKPLANGSYQRQARQAGGLG